MQNGGWLEEDRITREALAGLLRAAGLTPEDTASPMDVFGLAGDDVVPYTVLYRHLRLPEHARTLDILRHMPLVADLTIAVKRLILKDEDLSWPPRSAMQSIERAIDVAALKDLVRGDGPSGTTTVGIPPGSARRGDVDGHGPASDPPRETPRRVSLTVWNDSRELERVAAEVDDFAAGHRFPEQDQFQVKLCIEEILVYIVEHGYDDAGAHRIEVRLEMDHKDRTLAIRIVDDGRELEFGSFMFQPGPDTIEEETVLDGLGLHLVRSYVDDLRYRHEDGRNHLSLTKRIGN